MHEGSQQSQIDAVLWFDSDSTCARNSIARLLKYKRWNTPPKASKIQNFHY